MSTLGINLFPFPHFFDGKMLDGSIIPWPERCLVCNNKICKTKANNELYLCSHGYNYQKINKHITVGGILIREYNSTSKSRSKRFKKERNSIISKNMLDTCIQSVMQYDQSIRKDIETQKKTIN